MQTKEIISNI